MSVCSSPRARGVGVAHVADRANTASVNAHLVPYSPERNSMEQIVLFLKSNRFASRVFKDVAALKEACWMEWQWLTGRPSVITTMTQRGYAVAPSR